MIFPSDETVKERNRHLKALEQGGKAARKACEKILAGDPYDAIYLIALAAEDIKSGNSASALVSLWKAVESQPAFWMAYMDLAHAELDAGRKDLSDGLTELALRKLLRDQSSVDIVLRDRSSLAWMEMPGSEESEGAERIELLVESFRSRRDIESVETTARLRNFRLVDRIQGEDDLDRDFIDTVVREGETIVPILIGTLRDYARTTVFEETPWVAENTVALLGEIGAASAIPALLEFTTVKNTDIEGAAVWAIDRIIELNPDEAAKSISATLPELDGFHRIVVIRQLLRWPEWPAVDELYEQMSAGLKQLASHERGICLTFLLNAMILSRGPEGIKMARESLRRNAALLDRSTKSDCEEMVQTAAGSRINPLDGIERPDWTVYQICSGEAEWPGDDEEDDDVDSDSEDNLPIQTVRRTPTPGRNDPCWCGSGKKYKKCHLDEDASGSNSLKAPSRFSELHGRLQEFTLVMLRRAGNDATGYEFFGNSVGEAKEPDELSALVDWAMFDWIPSGLEHGVIYEFLKKYRSGLSVEDRALAEGWARSFVDLYEVQNVKPGVGVELKSLTSGEVAFVHDVRTSNTLVRWDALHCRIVEGIRGLEFSGTGSVVPRAHLQTVRKWMDRTRRDSGLEWPEYLKRNWPEIRRKGFAVAEKWAESLQLSNTDGEPLMFSKSVYEMEEPEEIRKALKRGSKLEDDGDGNFVWIRRTPNVTTGGDNTVLGNIRLAGLRMTLETNSRERLERGKEMISELAGPIARHLADELTTQKELKKVLRSKSAPKEKPEDEIPADVKAKLIGEMMEKHYSAWPDIALPALSGKTAREAVRTAAGKRKVIALLNDIENREERKRKDSEPFYDVSRLRKELGLS